MRHFTSLLILFSILFTTESNAQSFKVKNDGILLPKGNRLFVPFPENGHMIFDTTTNSVWFYDNIAWKEVGSDNLGNHTATDTLNMANNPIENVASPTNLMDATNKSYVDAHQDGDSDPLNEIQSFSVSQIGDTLYLSSSNWVIIPGVSDANYIKDFDGNVYNEVVIGNQTWLMENLITTHYNDGTPIPKMELNTDWDDWGASWNGSMYTDTYDAYTWYDNDSTLYNKFGAIYNWGVVDSTINGGKNACPEGYIIPTSSDISVLIAATGNVIAALSLKFPPDEYWQQSNDFPFGGNGTNDSNFSFPGVGERLDTGSFSNHRVTGWFWARTGGTMDNVHAVRMRYDDWEANIRTNNSGGEGFSIRCIKDE